MPPRCTPETTNEAATNPCENTPALYRGHCCRPRPWHHVRRSRQPAKAPKIRLTLCDETATMPPFMPKWLESRPTKRSECPPPGQLCPWVSCRYHLQIDVVPCGGGRSRVIVRSDPSTWTSKTKTCALEVADQGQTEWSEISAIYGRPPNQTKSGKPRPTNRGEADRQQVGYAIAELRENETMREVAEALGYDPNGRPLPGASSLPVERPLVIERTAIRIGADVERGLAKLEITAPEVRDVPAESVDLLGLLRQIRKKNGKLKTRHTSRPRHPDVCRPKKITYGAPKVERVSAPIEWIDL